MCTYQTLSARQGFCVDMYSSLSLALCVRVSCEEMLIESDVFIRVCKQMQQANAAGGGDGGGSGGGGGEGAVNLGNDSSNFPLFLKNIFTYRPIIVNSEYCTGNESESGYGGGEDYSCHCIYKLRLICLQQELRFY